MSYLPANFNEAKASEVLESTACILGQIRDSNEERTTAASFKAPFVGEDIPDLAVPEYCQRLAKYFRFSPSLYVAALIYIDRFVESNPAVLINRLTIHRLIITSFTIAAKYHEDLHYSNTYYAQVGGVDLKELNRLEYTMLTSIGFDLFITEETYSQYQQELAVHPSLCHQCNKDGFECQKVEEISTSKGKGKETDKPEHEHNQKYEKYDSEDHSHCYEDTDTSSIDFTADAPMFEHFDTSHFVSAGA